MIESKPVCDGCYSAIAYDIDQRWHYASRISDVCCSPNHSVGVFIVGETYLTKEGKSVTIVEAQQTANYETVLGDDGLWRYNRYGPDRGRVTGSPLDMSCPQNLVLAIVKTCNQ